MPKEYFNIDLDVWNTHDIYMILSIRQDAGKTTQSLLLGIVLFKLYGTTTEYMRCDETQLTRANLETIYDVILKFGYIEKLFKGEYNSLDYRPQLKKFFLCQRDEDGNIVKKCDRPLLVAHSLENWKRYKSSYNNPLGDFIVFDEFMDTDRQTNTQMVELQNNLSTIGRNREAAHCIMLGNNTNQYSFWFEEFLIENDIPNLNYGGYIENKTELGTTFYCTLWSLSDKKKDEIKLKKVRFSGFNTPKMNAFNGIGAWSGLSHPHIPDNDMLHNDFLIYDRLYIKHRNRYVKVKVYQNDDGLYTFCHYASKPLLDDNIILTLHPTKYGEIYGTGRYAPKFLNDKISMIMNLKVQSLWYYATNSVGELIADYFKELRY